MKKIILVALWLLWMSSGLSAANIAYIVADTTALAGDTIFVNRLEDFLGYEVKLIDDAAVDTFTTWSTSFDGIVISDLATTSLVASLKDTVVGILTMDRYTEAEFGFGATNYRPASHGRQLVNQRNCDYLCQTSKDTIFPYQYSNQYLYYYGDLADGAIVPFNTPDFVGHDSACVILLDQGAALSGGGTAVERRAFGGVFRTPTSMDYCHSWELFDRLATWAFDDTANTALLEYRCWAAQLEIDACWCEMTSGSNDSATYNSEFRFGFDGGSLLSFWRLTEPGRKAPPGYACDSLLLLFPIFNLGLNGTPADTIMDMRYTAYQIIKAEKWHGPPPNSGGDPYLLDSTWVTRWDVISGSDPVQWGELDLVAGVDYNSTVLDTFRINYPADSIGDTIRFKIAGSVFDIWADDTANNNGLVFKATAVYDGTSNVEYSTRPPIENAITAPMTIKAWFSLESETGVPDRRSRGLRFIH